MPWELDPICSKTDVEAYLGITSTVTAADDALIDMLRGMVENNMRSFVRHNITQPNEDYVHYLPDRKMQQQIDVLYGMEIYNGNRACPIMVVNNGDMLQLPQAFVRSITNVWVNYFAFGGQATDPWPDNSLLTLGVDVWMDDDYTGMCRSGMLYRFGMAWPAYPRSVKVQYMAGFTQDELANDGRYSFVRMAAIIETVRQFKLAKMRMGARSDGVGMVVAESFGRDADVKYDPKSMVFDQLSAECKMMLEPIMSLYQ